MQFRCKMLASLAHYRHGKGVKSQRSRQLQLLSNEQEAHASALQRRLIRSMDGGFIDNSSMAIGLSTLQTIKA